MVVWDLKKVLADLEKSASHIREVKEKEHQEGQRAGQSIQPKKGYHWGS